MKQAPEVSATISTANNQDLSFLGCAKFWAPLASPGLGFMTSLFPFAAAPYISQGHLA